MNYFLVQLPCHLHVGKSVFITQIARWNGSGCIFYSCSCDNVRHLQICSLCDSYDRLTVAHALLSCAGLESLRSVSWAAVTQSMSGPLAESLGSLCDNEKMIMLLSGLNCPYIPEWQVIYEDIITSLATMYTKFKANLDRLWSKWFPRAVHYTLKCHSNHTNLSHFGVRVGLTPAGPVHWPCVGPSLGQRRRRCTSIGSTWDRRIVPAGWFLAVYQPCANFGCTFSFVLL